MVVGQSAQLAAIAVLVNGTARTATADVTWQSSNSDVVSVTSGGLVTALAAGQTEIQASFQNVTARLAISVSMSGSPPVTRFTIAGTVHESAPRTDVPIHGATVEVAGGELDGGRFTTDANGRFELPPVGAPGFTLYFKRNGHEDVRVPIIDLPRDAILDVAMPPERRNLELVVGGPNSCTGIPEITYRYNSSLQLGGWLYARAFVHHDGEIVVSLDGFRQPFSIGTSFSIFRRASLQELPDDQSDARPSLYTGDRVIPVRGGYIYDFVASGDVNMCLPWGMRATVPR